ncbi:MAG: SPOR domain-containing protein [Bacteroidales bacterium]|nr:MAG: SPOR domain-containing protein [Bacteroidales bacterium]
MRNKVILALAVLLLSVIVVRGQNDQDNVSGNRRGINIMEEQFQTDQGRVQIYQDPRIDILLQRHIAYNRKKGGINGFRIQIYFGSGHTARENANESKARFLSYFPETRAHILYQSPFYKVRVGDFRTKNEALKFYRDVQRRFPNAYIVPDIIEFPELK